MPDNKPKIKPRDLIRSLNSELQKQMLLDTVESEILKEKLAKMLEDKTHIDFAEMELWLQ